ncbi:MAG: hypothetical protein ABIV28_05925 [Longimicrobiales bacterium]
MDFRKSLAAVAVLGLLVACEQSPTTNTTPTESTSFAIQTAIAGGGMVFQDGGPQPAVLGRLVHAALGKIRHDSGEEAARAAAAQLKPLIEAAHAARTAHDSTAARAAMNALRLAEATLVVNTLGTEPVTRSLELATNRVAAINEMATRAAAAGHDVARIQALAAAMTQKLADAKAAAAAGNNAAALLGAMAIVEGAHAMGPARGPHP